MNSCFIIFQFRGFEVIELESWKSASVEDVASVHAKAYVSGLEKVGLCSTIHLIYISNLIRYFTCSPSFIPLLERLWLRPQKKV